jgi:hypothetical protein
MKYSIIAVLVSSTVIPMAVAGTLAERRSVSSSPDAVINPIERAVTAAVPRSGGGDVADIVSQLEADGFKNLLPQADSDLSKRVDVGLPESQWVAVPASCVRKILESTEWAEDEKQSNIT